MYQLWFFLMTFLVTIQSSVGQSKFIPLKKLHPGSFWMTSRKFYRLNKAHLLHSYCEDIRDEKDHLTDFHSLQYTGQIDIGKPSQPLTVIMDTGIGDILVLSSDYCRFLNGMFNNFCWHHHTYNSQKSETSKKEPEIYPTYIMRQAGMTGHLVYDQLKIGKWTVPKLVIGTIDDWTHGFSYSKVDGIVGFAPREASMFAKKTKINNVRTEEAKTISSHLTLAESLQKQGASKIGFHLYQDVYGEELGELVLGVEDGDKTHVGEITWNQQAASNPEFSLNGVWRSILFQFILIGMGDGKRSEVLNMYYMIPDPGTAVIAGPTRVMTNLNHHLFQGLKGVKRKYRDGTVEFDCRYTDQLPIIVFHISKRGYVMEPKDYIKKFRGGKCTSGFMAMDKLDVIVLGDTFIRKYYTVFDYENKMIGFAPSIPKKAGG